MRRGDDTELDELITAANPAATADVPGVGSETGRRIASRVMGAARTEGPPPAERCAGAVAPWARSPVLRAAAVIAFCGLVAVGALYATSAGGGHATASGRTTTTVGQAVTSTTSTTVASTGTGRHPTVPAGWVPVTLGKARIFVPSAWKVTDLECTSWSAPGTVFVRTASALTAYCGAAGAPTVLSSSDNAVILTPIGVLDAPGPSIGTARFGGLAAAEYAWPSGWNATESHVRWPAGTREVRVPALGVNVVVTGPLAATVLSTLGPA